MVSVKTLAQYLLSLSDPLIGDGISNLKLQKLLYYCQGVHLAAKNKRLFREPIEAWVHGSVVPLVYHEYKEYESDHIPIPKGVNFKTITANAELRELIDEVYSAYGQFSAWRLRDMTHSEPPWTNTKVNEVISCKKMREYFIKVL